MARKELREAVRDRRSLGSALLYALWGPLVMALALMALARDRGAEPPLTIAFNPASAPGLAAFLAERSATLVPIPDDLEARVRDRTVDVALAADERYAGEFESARPARVTLVFDGSRRESESKAARVRALVGEYSRRIADSRLILRGVSPSAASPLRIEERDVSTAAGRAATILAALPIFLLLSAFIGGMGAAADMMAGERERASLEPLLLHPVPRGAIVLGKWAAASALALATVTLTLAVSQAVLRHPRIQAFDVPVGLSTSDAAQMWIVLAPLALLAAAAQALVALFARTYKEAHTQLSLMIFLPMLPGFLFAFGSAATRPWMSWTPMLGQHVMIGGLLRGEPAAPAAVAALSAITLAACAAVLVATTVLLARRGAGR